MSLQTQLSELKAQNIERIPEEAMAVIVADMEKLSASDIVAKAPKVGDKLKDFSLPNQSGKTRTLKSYLDKGPVVVTFYRGGWCPYCNLELLAYQNILSEIVEQGATLLAITPELPDASLTTTEKNELDFEVLTDKNSAYGRDINIVFTLADELRSIYAQFGLDLEKHNGTGQFDLPLAATFVVDVNGTITFAGVDVDYTQRAEPSDVVNELKKLVG